jgi:FtsZ-binding cell division protein ZapB
VGHAAAGALIGGPVGLIADQLAGQEKGLTVESEQNQRDIERLRRENERLREECIER